MAEPFNVKARGRHGTESLDLTVPADLKREHEITEGDVFIVEVNQEENKLEIIYEKIYNSGSDD